MTDATPLPDPYNRCDECQEEPVLLAWARRLRMEPDMLRSALAAARQHAPARCGVYARTDGRCSMAGPSKPGLTSN